MSEDEFTVLSVPLSPETEKQVELVARQRGITASEFIIAAVIDALAAQEREYAADLKNHSHNKSIAS